MLKEERREIIISIVNKNGFVDNRKLAEITNSTIQTIIADVRELSDEGSVIKVYGGAKSINAINHYQLKESFDEEKAKINIEAKNLIGKKATNIINEGDLIFIDTGTTTKKMISYLSNRNVNVVTNGYSIALELMEQDIDVCIIGGTILPSTHATVGELSLKFIDHFYFDKVFIGMNNIDENSYYTTNIQEALIKERVIKNSNKAFILADSSKFNSKNKIKVDIQKKVTLISDKTPHNFKGEVIICNK
ncbi:DeoR/GlpR family DNA-binding transcription regulator [Spiroplasma endosymbiont of Aspidapion aeneum]|uniref:DeoR/GlpR family DNA-binding transcription regulator n=1 Tax=Spiroplasma endosymbiont of Aspidapion aeneum TaxID=3066276 RepID=UPI00313B10B4